MVHRRFQCCHGLAIPNPVSNMKQRNRVTVQENCGRVVQPHHLTTVLVHVLEYVMSCYLVPLHQRM
jgi:hypothetical protein